MSNRTTCFKGGEGEGGGRKEGGRERRGKKRGGGRGGGRRRGREGVITILELARSCISCI